MSFFQPARPWGSVTRVMTVAAVAVGLSACGFQLRGSTGHYNLPFNKFYIGLPASAPLAIDLKRNIRAIGGTQITEAAAEADGVLDVLSDPDKTRSKSILSLNTNGRVREYSLNYTIRFRVRDNHGNELLAPTTITLTRAQTYDESQVLAKEVEAEGLYRDMEKDLVSQLLRRMAAIKPVVNASPAVLTEPAATTPASTSASSPAASPAPATQPAVR
jgi:LPS-assembly lipoprotein